MTKDRSVPVDMADLKLIVVVFEANLINNSKEWWIDIGATRHPCSEKEMFSLYTPLNGRNSSWVILLFSTSLGWGR